MTTQIVTTVVAPASSYDLTTLLTVHDELGLLSTDTSADSFLSRAITQISLAVASYCNRVFPVEGVQDLAYIDQDPYPYQTPGGVRPLQLSRFPLAYSAVVPFTGNTHGTVTVDGIPTASAALLKPGMPLFGGGLPAGAAIATVNATGGSITVSPSTVTPAAATGVSFTTGIQVIQTLAAGVTQTLTYGTDFTADPAVGQLVRLNTFTGVQVAWEALPTQVNYAAGYATVPADLEMATLQMVTARYSSRGRDPNLMMRNQGGTVGEERFWVGAPPGQNGPFPPEIQALLNKYRVPVTG